MRLQPTTSLVETTGLVEQKPLTVFSTITVVDCSVFSFRTIFALSTLLRQNSGGLDEFNRADGGTKLFKKLSTMEGDGPDVVRAKIKGLSFLSDLHDSIELLDSSHCDLFDDVQVWPLTHFFSVFFL